MQVRAILFRRGKEKMFAQVEQFFFSKRPLHIAEASGGVVTLPICWPTDPLEELPHYGTMYPNRKTS